MEQQRSIEWFAKRKGKITGSNVGAILGLSPFKKPCDVMRQMVREYHGAESEFTGNILTRYGTDCEPIAISAFENETGFKVIETGFHIHPYFSWLGASPDGFIGENSLIEIKCPFSKRHGNEPFKKIEEQLYYYAQIQIELFCTNKKQALFYQWSAHHTAIELVQFDQSWIDYYVPKLYEFYKQFLLEINNPAHLEPLVSVAEQNDELVKRYHSAKVAMEEAKADLEEIKAELIKLADGKKTQLGDILIYPIERKGSINYSKIVKEHLPDLDLIPYTGKATSTWGIK